MASVDQTRADVLTLERRSLARPTHNRRRRALLARLTQAAMVALVLVLAGGGAVDAQQARERAWSMAVMGRGFDLVRWEANAIWEKAGAAVTRPARGQSPEDASRRVVEYMERAERIGQVEGELVRLASEGRTRADPEMAALVKEVQELRQDQQQTRPQVEQIIERQVGYGLAEAGFTVLRSPFPPVKFSFTEPPKKLIVSPRDRILTAHSRMLSPDIRLSEAEEAEAAINAGERARAYITSIGGLGAFPTMVVDRASLEWVLSTVAHEWAHNYLTLYPLGWNYFRNQDMTSLNESVAEIVGNEIGAEVTRLFYTDPGILPSFAGGHDGAGEEAEAMRIPVWEIAMERRAQRAPSFDFRKEMRATRLHVDELLAEGRIDEAEAYMEARRQEFVEAGHPLRVLNQAYFAFHGSYGTSPSATSPIGPKLDELRALTPTLEEFLSTVRWFTDASDLDAALDEWSPRPEGSRDVEQS